MTLKTPEEIAESIKTYLKQKVAAINTQLSRENNNVVSYYSPKAGAFNKLATVNPQASPRGRQYGLLPENFFIDALTEQTINSVAQVLYWQNL